MLGMLAVFAELQRAEIRERTKVKLRAKRDGGEAVSRAAFGLKRSGKGSTATRRLGRQSRAS
jgi:DNA invertase Pin-like site-specific DNA recombinase